MTVVSTKMHVFGLRADAAALDMAMPMDAQVELINESVHRICFSGVARRTTDQAMPDDASRAEMTKGDAMV